MKDFDTHKFLGILKTKYVSCKYHYEGKWLVLDGDNEGYAYLHSSKLDFLPDYIKFNNNRDVFLHNNFLKSLPDNIEFNNGNDVYLTGNIISSLPDGVKFNNDGKVYLDGDKIESLPNNIDEFFHKLDRNTIRDFCENFPDHWVVNKERFNL